MQNPDAILRPYVKPGMTAADIGCALGFFSLPLARLVGPEGRVICVDLQEKLIESLRKRARKASVLDRLDFRTCSETSLNCDDLNGTVDLVLAFAVVHEVPDQERLFREMHAMLKSGGTLLFAEPSGHVKRDAFESSLVLAAQQKFTMVDQPTIRRSHAALLRKG